MHVQYVYVCTVCICMYSMYIYMYYVQYVYGSERMFDVLQLCIIFAGMHIVPCNGWLLSPCSLNVLQLIQWGIVFLFVLQVVTGCDWFQPAGNRRCPGLDS